MKDEERLDLPSASNDAFWNCPGQWQLSQKIPAETTEPGADDPDAERGTRIHEAYMTGNTMTLSADELEDYQAGLKFTDQIVAAWMSDNNLIEMKEGPREERLWIHDPTTLKPVASGKLDRHYISGTHALIVDLKSGWAAHVPPAPRSTQGRLQSVLLWTDKPELTRIRFAFAKAKAKYGAKDATDYTLSDLKFAQDMISAHLWESREPDATLRPGAWCHFCPCKSICQAAAAYSLLPSVIAATGAEMVASLSLEDCSLIMSRAGTIGKIIEEVKRRMKALPPNALAALGWQLTQGRELSDITKAKECFEFLKSQQLWSEGDIWSAIKFSQGKLAEIVKREKNLSSDKSAQAWVKTALDEFMTKTRSEGSLRQL